MKSSKCMLFLGSIFLLIPFNTFSGSYNYDIRQSMQECNVDRSSVRYRDAWIDPPSCIRVKELIKLQRLETEAETSVQTGQPMPAHVEIDDRRY